MNRIKPSPTCISLVRASRRLARYFDHRRVLKGTIVFSVLFVLFWLIGWGRLDPDFGWHLQAGNFIRHYGIPAHDIYTYTARSYPWIDFEWGNDIILSVVYGLGGYALVSVLYALIWSGAVMLAAPRARLVTLLFAAIAMTPYAGNRPLAWSTLFFALEFCILRKQNLRWRWWLVPLFIIWANIHAGFIAGLAVLAYYALRERKRIVVYLLIVCVFATALNAYGLRLYGEIARTIFDPQLHSQIIEWGYFSIAVDGYLFLLLWATGFWLYDRTDLKRWFGLSPLLLAATLSASRNMPFFVVSASQELDDYISRVRQSIPKHLDRSRKIVLALLISSVFVWFGYSVYASYLPWTSRYAYYPMQAVAYLQTHHCAGNLFNSYDYGGYLIWKLPSQPVYIDGRMPTWQPYMNRYVALVHNPAANYKQQFRQYNIRCALLTEGLANANFVRVLQQAHWRTVIRANGSVLLLAP